MKKQLINNLTNDVYCRIMPSKIHGVGVFAIKDIPKGIDPFKTTNNIKYNSIELYDQDIKDLDINVKKMLDDFFGKECTYVPLNGLNSLDISFYMNSTENPNIDTIDDEKSEYFVFRTNRDIKKGEELFIKYTY